jgi:SNF2 family DNA or RNA helicase
VSDRKSMEPYLKDEVAFYDHQVEGIRKMMRMKSVLLADDMGLGKSIQALTVFVGDVIQGKGSTAIIVCPVSLRGNWADEWQGAISRTTRSHPPDRRILSVESAKDSYPQLRAG